MTVRTKKQEKHPYEEQILKYLDAAPELKFGEIIMRLGISVRHGQKLMDSLLRKGLVIRGTEANVYIKKDHGDDL